MKAQLQAGCRFNILSNFGVKSSYRSVKHNEL